MLACGAAQAQPDTGFAPGRILALPAAGLSETHLERIVKENGAKGARRIGRSELRIVDVPPGQERATVEKLRRHPHFKFAELDQQVRPATVTNDPYLGSSWHLARINAPTAWASTQGSGVTIAILDTGVDAHPDLAANLLPGWNFIDNNSNTADPHGHGTAVAGAAAAVSNNGVGVAAVSGAARILPVRIADANAYAFWSTVAQGITWAADRGARVANVSYVGVAGSATIQNAAAYMKSRGGLVVVSAGNNNRDEGVAPTSTMIAVSATDENDQKASFSSWGNFVALAAPGVNVWTTHRGGSYMQWGGTSIAAPVTAGVVALAMARNPALTPADVENILFSTAVDLGTPGRDAVFGFGRVDAAGAVAAASASVSSADTSPPAVGLTSPGGGATVAGLVSVTASASDNRGVSRVELRVNGAVAATDSSAPYSFSWDSSRNANGGATLTAVAYDAAGNAATSSPVTVTVANVAATPVAPDATPPTLAFRNPLSGSTVSGTVQVQVTAADNSGTAGLQQTLFINDRQVASATGGTLSFSWNTRKIARGTYTLRAVVRDAAGNSSTASIAVNR